ncbi:MAG TPA: alpha/beta fold hydrolase [Chroococcales cyanobacterium]
MTILPALKASSAKAFVRQEQPLFVDVSPDSKILVHYNATNASAHEFPTMVLVHGLEGSSASPYLLSLASKAVKVGFNTVRVNLRNCGGTIHLSPSLYNAGMSSDIVALLDYLSKTMSLRNFFLVGYSLGGNIVLKTAGELGSNAVGRIAGVCAVSPAIDLSASIDSIECGLNRMYELRFMQGLRAKIKAKAKLYPERYDLRKLKHVRGLRSFDELFTAPDAGFTGADHYYHESSSIKVLENIRVPTLIVAAQDDPIVPFASFLSPKLQSRYITLLSPEHGGHGGFIQHREEFNERLQTSDRLWADNRILEFCLEQAQIQQ